MITEILSGKELSKEIREKVSSDVEKLKSQGKSPTLAVLVATDDESTAYYVRHIQKAGAGTGIEVAVTSLEPDASFEQLASELNKLAVDESVHGIILQTPLPSGVEVEKLRSLIPTEKDIDGANPLSAGRLTTGMKAYAPSTAMAVIELLDFYDMPISGTHAVIIGRSLVVGKPLAQLLLAKDATVTVCHSKTRDMAEITKTADILIVAMGKPKLIDSSYIKQGAVVIDVGTNVHDDGSLVGDVNAQDMMDKAGALSPVPGGVGPVTTGLLLKQLVQTLG